MPACAHASAQAAKGRVDDRRRPRRQTPAVHQDRHRVAVVCVEPAIAITITIIIVVAVGVAAAVATAPQLPRAHLAVERGAEKHSVDRHDDVAADARAERRQRRAGVVPERPRLVWRRCERMDELMDECYE